MMLTYKLKHGSDFSDELRKARQVAEFAIKTRTTTSKDVRHIGLKSAVANQILRKYGRNKNVKRVKSVKLTVPGQGVKVDKQSRTISIPCLKLVVQYLFPDFEKVNQIEVGEEYAFVTVTVLEEMPVDSGKYIGVDLNTTGHAAVVGNPETGKVWKLGKQALHVHSKYRKIRSRLQKLGKKRKLKQIKSRQSRIIRNINHHISKKIVAIAKTNACGIKLEELKHIRKTSKSGWSFRYSLNSWSFYQLQKFVEYKAKLQGVIVAYVEPAYTSKLCSTCGSLGERDEKKFKCLKCGHVENADVNASFNIALRPAGVSRSSVDRDALEGRTDTPRSATLGATATLEPLRL